MTCCWKPIFLFTALCCLSLAVSAQEIAIKRIELEQEKVSLFYDLMDSTVGRFYTIHLYSSRDNFITPIQNAIGDLGLEVRPGSNRKIQINAKEEFGREFEGKLAFELRAKVYIPFIRMEAFDHFRKFKRGKVSEIRWSGGRPSNILNFDLYSGDHKVHTFSGIPNGGKYNVLFPMDIKPGKHYRFRISDSKNRDEVVNTQEFSISRKVPLAIKVIPIVAIGGTIYLLTSSKQECKGCLPEFPVPKDN